MMVSSFQINHEMNLVRLPPTKQLVSSQFFRFVSLTNPKQQATQSIDCSTIVKCGQMMKHWNQSKRDSQKTIELFNKVVNEKTIKHNFITCLLALGACANTQNIKQGQLIHQMIQQNEIVVNARLDKIKLSNSLINMYMKCDDVNSAEMVFEQMASSERDSVTYGAMCKGIPCQRQQC